MIKAGLNAELDGQAGIKNCGRCTMLYYTMDEAQEGGRAFLEKRKPDFDKISSISISGMHKITITSKLLHFLQPAETSRGVYIHVLVFT